MIIIIKETQHSHVVLTNPVHTSTWYYWLIVCELQPLCWLMKQVTVGVLINMLSVYNSILLHP